MNRRRFLTLTSALAGLGAAAQAGGLSATRSEPQDALEAARARAKAGGKPLLVAWLPTIDFLATRRSVMWREFFQKATNRQLALLSLCEVVFAHPLDGEEENSKSELGWLENTAQSKPIRIPLGTNIKNARSLPGFEDIGRNLEQALVPDKETLRHWQQRSTPNAEDLMFFAPITESFESSLRIPTAHLNSFAALAWGYAENQPKLADHIHSELARTTLARLFDTDPPGAQWQINYADPCPPCGMARIPPSAQILLTHYTKK